MIYANKHSGVENDMTDNWDLVEAGNELPLTVNLSSLTYAELKILTLMLDPEMIALTIKERCDKIGCSRETWYRAMKKPVFLEAMNQLTMGIFRENTTRLAHATVKYALAGSFQHMKLALEAGGIIQREAGETGEITIRFADPRAPIVDVTPRE